MAKCRTEANILAQICWKKNYGENKGALKLISCLYTHFGPLLVPFFISPNFYNFIDFPLILSFNFSLDFFSRKIYNEKEKNYWKLIPWNHFLPAVKNWEKNLYRKKVRIYWKKNHQKMGKIWMNFGNFQYFICWKNYFHTKFVLIICLSFPIPHLIIWQPYF